MPEVDWDVLERLDKWYLFRFDIGEVFDLSAGATMTSLKRDENGLMFPAHLLPASDLKSIIRSHNPRVGLSLRYR